MSTKIFAALLQAQKGYSPALKDSENPHYRSKYADLGNCVDAVLAALNGAGIALAQTCQESPDGVVVETVFLHESGETWGAGKLFIPSSKRDAQGFGSALTYARRYSLMAACGIAPEDDDGNAASAPPVPRQAPPPKPAPSMPLDIDDIAMRVAATDTLTDLEAKWRALGPPPKTDPDYARLAEVFNVRKKMLKEREAANV